MKKSVFFSWQSDAPRNKNFIERSLQQALRELARDPDIEIPKRDLVVDRDTSGVSGTPPIVDTIFAKIDHAWAFVPDLTFVGKRLNGTPTPNPNVLIEYGWAAKSLGYSRLIPVMNVAYGEPTSDAMPFDLRHLRNPITFRLPDDADDDAVAYVKSELARAFKHALKLILENSTLSEMGLDQSFGSGGISILPELCFAPKRLRVCSANQDVLVAGFVDGIPHVAKCTPGGSCNDAPLPQEAIEDENKINYGTFLFSGSEFVLAGVPNRPGSLFSEQKNGTWVPELLDYDLIISGEQSFFGWLSQGRVLIFDEQKRLVRLQLDQEARFTTQGCHSIRRQGAHIYLYWVPAPQLHHGLVARFDLEGRLDQSFGDQGIVSFPTEYGPRGRVLNFLNITDLCVQRDGKILIAGYGNDANIIRLLPDGARDDTFGSNGAIVFRADSRSSLARLICTDDYLYAFGDQNSGNVSSHYVARISHQGEVLSYLTLNGKGQSSVVDAEIVAGYGYVLCHFNADASMHSCAALHRIRI